MLSQNSRLFNAQTASWKIYTTSTVLEQDNPETIGASGFSQTYSTTIPSVIENWNIGYDCLDGWWCINLDPRAAIGEFGIAIHRNGLISVIAIPRFGVSQKVVEHFQRCHVGFKTHDEPNLTDARFKLIATANLDALDALNQFIAATNSISTLSIELQQHIAHVIEKAKTINFANYTDEKARITNWRHEFNFPELPSPFYFVGAANSLPNSTLFFGKRYEPRFHRHYPEGRTELTAAIIANDLDRVEMIINKNPHSIFQMDAYGHEPLMLGVTRGNFALAIFLLLSARTISDKSPQIQKKIDIAFMILIGLKNEFDSLLSSHYLESIYCKASEVPKQRPELHQACARLEINDVISTLNKYPEQLNAMDGWCMTPIIIAIGEGRADVVELLLQRGAKLTTQEYPGQFSVINSATDIEVLKVILKYHANVNDNTTLAHEAVRNNRLDILRLLYRYGRSEKQDDSGLTPIEIAINKADTSGEFAPLQFLLEKRDTYVVVGPYDADFKPEVIQLLEKHNASITKTRQQLFERPKVRDIRLSQKKLITTLEWNQQAIISTIKSTDDLTSAERVQIYDLYERTFTPRLDDSPQNRRAFLDSVLPMNGDANVWVEVCQLQDRVLSFFSFQIMHGHFVTCGEFTLFDGKLAAVDERFASLGLANFIFRIPLAMKMLASDKPLFVYFKAIRPGFSWCMLPTVDCDVYPKYHEDPNLVRHVVQMTGEDMPEPGVIPAILRVNRQAPSSDQIKEYEDLAGNKVENALPIFWVVNHKTIKGYIGKLHFNGITEQNIMHTGECFLKLLPEEKRSEKRMVALQRL